MQKENNIPTQEKTSAETIRLVRNGENYRKAEEEEIKKAAKWDEVSYAHPYSSWERGSNENENRILRRFVPKGTGIGTLSAKETQRMEGWANNCPRKILRCESSAQLVA